MTSGWKLLLAMAALLGPPLAHGAAAADWRVVQTGENFEGVWSGGPRDNLVGGGGARMSGGGDNAEIVYTGPLPSETPRMASLSGGADNLTIDYGTVPAASPTLAAGPGRRPTELAEARPSTRVP